MEKNKLLKVSSILLIVFGALMAFGGIIMMVAGDFVAEIIGIAGEEAGAGADADAAAAIIKTAMIILGVIALIEAIAYIAAGVIGVQQKSAQTCFIIAIVLVVLCGIGAITNIIEGNWFGGIVGLVVPVLYLVGAIQLKKAVADEVLNSSVNNETI